LKHATQVLNYEKRKLINRLYEMQEENDYQGKHSDEAFQKVKKKITQVDDAIKYISDRVERAEQVTDKPIRPTVSGRELL